MVNMALGRKTSIGCLILLICTLTLVLTSCSLFSNLTGTSKTLTTSQDILDTLASKPFAASELPSGFSSPEIVKRDKADWWTKSNVFGGVTLNMKGPDAMNFVNFWVFATQEDAASYLESGWNTIYEVFTSVDFGRPSYCFSFQSTGEKKYGVSQCFILVDRVVIVSVSWLNNGKQWGNGKSVISLGIAAVAHLNKLGVK